MKRLFLAVFGIASIIALGALGGCRTYHTPPMDRRITVSPDLGYRVWVTDVRLAKVESDQYTFQANIVNNTYGVQRLEYRVAWLDANGVEMDSVMSTWQKRSVAGREVVALKAVAPSPDACDFRFYVQRERR